MARWRRSWRSSCRRVQCPIDALRTVVRLRPAHVTANCPERLIHTASSFSPVEIMSNRTTRPPFPVYDVQSRKITTTSPSVLQILGSASGRQDFRPISSSLQTIDLDPLRNPSVGKLRSKGYRRTTAQAPRIRCPSRRERPRCGHSRRFSAVPHPTLVHVPMEPDARPASNKGSNEAAHSDWLYLLAQRSPIFASPLRLPFGGDTKRSST